MHQLANAEQEEARIVAIIRRTCAGFFVTVTTSADVPIERDVFNLGVKFDRTSALSKRARQGVLLAVIAHGALGAAIVVALIRDSWLLSPLVAACAGVAGALLWNALSVTATHPISEFDLHYELSDALAAHGYVVEQRCYGLRVYSV